MSSDPEHAGLIGAADRGIDRVVTAVKMAAADETLRNFAAVSVAASAAALFLNVLPVTAPVSAVVLLSMAGPLYLAQHANFVDLETT